MNKYAFIIYKAYKMKFYIDVKLKVIRFIISFYFYVFFLFRGFEIILLYKYINEN